MFIVHAHKKLSMLLLCTFLMIQPLQAISFDIPNKNIIFPLLFISACALLGMLTSHFRKINAPTKEIPKEIPTEKEKEIIYSNKKTKKLNLGIAKKPNDNLPFAFTQLKNTVTEQAKKIENLEQRCDKIMEQNNRLLVITHNMQQGSNGFVPAFVAAYWFHKYTEQTQTADKYKQNILARNSLAMLNNQ